MVRYLKQRCQDRLELLSEVDDEGEHVPEEVVDEQEQVRDWTTTNFKVAPPRPPACRAGS